MSFPARHDATKVVEPGKETFDFPAAARAPQGPPILRTDAPTTVRRNHLDAIRLHQGVIERVAVVPAIADQSRREVGEEALLKRGRHEVRLIR